MTTYNIPESQYEKLYKLFQEHKNCTRIQEITGFDRKEIGKVLKSLGVELLGTGKISLKLKDKIISDFKNGKTVKKLSEELEVTSSAVRNFIKKHSNIVLDKTISVEVQKEIIEKYLNHIPLKQICKELNIGSEQTIFRVLAKNKIPIHQKTHKINKTLAQKILKRASEIPGQTSKLAKEFGLSNAAVVNLFKKEDIISYGSSFKSTQVSDTVNINYFDKLDSPVKAYILGLFYSDGYASTEKNTSVIALQDQDKYILERIREEIHLNKELVFRKRKKLHHKDNFAIEIYSKQFAQTLHNLGCFERKSLILKWPHPNIVPDKYIWHFIRGCFDGDGSIYKMSGDNKKGRLEFSLIGAPDFITGFHKFLYSVGIKNEIKTRVITKAISVKSSRQINIKAIYELMYKDCGEWFLTRKKEVFDNWSKNYKFTKNCLKGI